MSAIETTELAKRFGSVVAVDSIDLSVGGLLLMAAAVIDLSRREMR